MYVVSLISLNFVKYENRIFQYVIIPNYKLGTQNPPIK
jgi:hypothetical protein